MSNVKISELEEIDNLGQLAYIPIIGEDGTSKISQHNLISKEYIDNNKVVEWSMTSAEWQEIYDLLDIEED